MAYRSGGPVLIFSALGLLVGTIVLVYKKRFGDLFLFYLMFLSVPAYVKFVVSPAEDANTRVWLALPVALLAPAWVLSGIYVGKCAIEDDEGTIADHVKNVWAKLSRNLNTRPGAVGMIAFVIATVAWGDLAYSGASASGTTAALDFLFVLGGWLFGIVMLFRSGGKGV